MTAISSYKHVILFIVISWLKLIKSCLYVNYKLILDVICLFTVEIREVKEVRIGKQSKDFEKWPEDAKRIENLRCFVVYYGSEFRLKTLSISGKCDICIYYFCC